MTNEEFRRVEAWLYSIPRIEIALESLKLELETLDTRAASPPTWMSNPSPVFVMGGDMDSRQARWVEFMDEYQVRRNEITEKIREREQQLACFEKVMDMLRSEDGKLAQLVRKKYVDKVRPDRTIWKDEIFVGKTTFYAMRNYTVRVFFESLPGLFISKRANKKRTKCEPKSA